MYDLQETKQENNCSENFYHLPIGLWKEGVWTCLCNWAIICRGFLQKGKLQRECADSEWVIWLTREKQRISASQQSLPTTNHQLSVQSGWKGCKWQAVSIKFCLVLLWWVCTAGNPSLLSVIVDFQQADWRPFWGSVIPLAWAPGALTTIQKWKLLCSHECVPCSELVVHLYILF